jgi:hypothetical protein
MRSEFLVLYDYGTGGSWAYLQADSEGQIHARYPQLKVMTVRPEWLTPEVDANLRRRMTIDINDSENPFLAALNAQDVGEEG